MQHIMASAADERTAPLGLGLVGSCSFCVGNHLASSTSIMPAAALQTSDDSLFVNINLESRLHTPFVLSLMSAGSVVRSALPVDMRCQMRDSRWS